MIYKIKGKDYKAKVTIVKKFNEFNAVVSVQDTTAPCYPYCDSCYRSDDLFKKDERDKTKVEAKLEAMIKSGEIKKMVTDNINKLNNVKSTKRFLDSFNG